MHSFHRSFRSSVDRQDMEGLLFQPQYLQAGGMRHPGLDRYRIIQIWLITPDWINHAYQGMSLTYTSLQLSPLKYFLPRTRHRFGPSSFSINEADGYSTQVISQNDKFTFFFKHIVKCCSSVRRFVFRSWAQTSDLEARHGMLAKQNWRLW